MPDWHDFRVKNDEERGYKAEVMMDGEMLKGVTHVNLDIDAQGANLIQITFRAKSINKDGAVVDRVNTLFPDNGQYDAQGNFIHRENCRWLKADHVGRGCSDKPDGREAQQRVGEPYHEWHLRAGEDASACLDCYPPSEGDA